MATQSAPPNPSPAATPVPSVPAPVAPPPSAQAPAPEPDRLPTHSFVPSSFYPAPGLTLQQVHVFSRHGERSPVRVRMPAFFPARWNLCHVGRQFSAAVLEPSGSAEEGLLKVNRKVDVPKGVNGGQEGECLLGELTDKGRETTRELGQSLRRLYVDELKFLAPNPDPQQLFFRSTNMSRTVESLQQVIVGLYPASTRPPTFRANIHIRNMTEESLLPNTFSCKRLRDLDKQFARAAALAWNDTLRPLDKKLSKFIDGKPVRIDGSPAASGIMDTVRAAESNGLPVPKEFNDPETRATLENAICHEWFSGYYSSTEFRTLSMGRLLSDLTSSLSASIAQPTSPTVPRLSVNSCHDTTLAAMLATLGVFDHKWPGFTSHVSVELFKGTGDENKSWGEWAGGKLGRLVGKPGSKKEATHYVRLRYNGRALPLPACAKQGRHLEGAPEVCTFDAFKKAVEKVTPDDWAKECEAVGEPQE